MTQFEYKVIPAPTKGHKAPGLKTAEARFANAVQERMNELAADGWVYLRSDLLPSEERQGLTSSQTIYRSVLVFQRALAKPQKDAVETVEEHINNTPENTEVKEETPDSTPREWGVNIPSDPKTEDTDTSPKTL